MSVDKPSVIEIPEPKTIERTTYTTYARGGRGNPILIGWSYGTAEDKEKSIDGYVHEVKPYYVGKPRLVNRKGKIIRFQRNEELA